eukprot:TRINITY_DN30210_c0_g1_i1.p1 TRINITY_DN30210_c0_g1~~TRINITY_DN30210_c0_g1_i1.p1  ORF type:complete len:743 (+),score=132.34 TRINITY_DN30210_c0_g1_i1:57-2285(+)
MTRHTALLTFGSNDNKQLGYSGGRHVTCPRMVCLEEAGKLKGVSCSCGHTYVWDDTGAAWKAGDGNTGFVRVFGEIDVKEVAGCALFTLIKDTAGGVHYHDPSTRTTTRLDIPCAKSIHTGALFGLVLATNGTVYTMGMNTQGQLGIPPTTTTDYTTPHKVPDVLLIQASCGAEHVLGIAPSGHLYGWGHNARGELGPHHLKAVVPSPLRLTLNDDEHDGNDGSKLFRRGDVASVHCGDRETVILKADGAAVGWGMKGSLEGLDGVLSASAGGGWNNTHTLLLQRNADGHITMLAMGSNSKGQLGITPPRGVLTLPTYFTVQEVCDKDEYTGIYKIEALPSGASEWRKGKEVLRKQDNFWVLKSEQPNVKRAWVTTCPLMERHPKQSDWIMVEGGYKTRGSTVVSGRVMNTFSYVLVTRSDETTVFSANLSEVLRPYPIYFDSNEPIIDVKLSAGWVHSAALVITENPLFICWKGDFGSLSALPTVVLVEIGTYLCDRRTFCCISRGFHKISQNDAFWARFGEKPKTVLPDLPKNCEPWKDRTIYQRLLIKRGQRSADTLFSSGGLAAIVPEAVRSLFVKKEFKMVMLGLDASGKTTILYKLKLGEIVTTIPTIGFNVETVEYKKAKFTMWDVGGPDKIRALWKHYFEGLSAVIFVVDSNDKERLGLARDELHRLLSEEATSNPVLVYANKQDLPNALPVSEIITGLGLDTLRHRKWHVQGSAARAGTGIYEGLEWLANMLS